MEVNKIKLIFLIVSSLSFCNCCAQLTAFPGAEGFGKYSVGGRGGDVVFVTNLNDSGEGSLRAACEQSGPRTIIFRTGGTISLNSTIEITNPNITIAGQTAPGGGICLKMNNEVTSGNLQATLAIITSDVIIRGMRFRAGPSSPLIESIQINDCLDIWDGENIIIDHCSFTWGNDENIAIWSDIPDEQPQKITIQKSIIGQGLQKLDNGNITRGFGLLAGGSTGATEVSLIGNLFIHNTQRNPLLKSEQPSIFELNNNVIYNYGFFGTDMSDDVMVNLISNFYLEGNNTTTNRYEILIQEQASLYVEGNIGLHRMNEALLEWDIVGFNGTIPPNGYSESPAPLSFQSSTPFAPIPDEIESGQETYNNLTSSMDIGANYKLDESGNGSFVNNFDEVDLSLIQDLINETGSTIFDTDIGTNIQYPILLEGTAPLDSDEDGMPDIWEESCVLNVNDPSDRNDLAFNNYTNLENYLNGVSCIPTSIKGTSNQLLSVYPNPTNGYLIIETQDSEDHIIALYNLLGNKVYETKLPDETNSIDLSMLNTGFYFLTLNDSRQRIKVILTK